MSRYWPDSESILRTFKSRVRNTGVFTAVLRHLQPVCLRQRPATAKYDVRPWFCSYVVACLTAERPRRRTLLFTHAYCCDAIGKKKTPNKNRSVKRFNMVSLLFKQEAFHIMTRYLYVMTCEHKIDNKQCSGGFV